MLTVHPVGPGCAAYYADDLAPGRAEGSWIEGEPPGRWVGGASGGLGLAGTVDQRALALVLEGRRPADGVPLGAAHRRSVGGFDLTFAAPKSVSLLAMLGPEHVADAARAGHEGATAAALTYLADRALVARRGSGEGLHLVTTTGWLAGAFDHHTSRALDPHLHTHVVAANAVHGADGRWTSLDSRRLYAHLRAGGAIYQAELRARLTASLGVGWEPRGHGTADVAGVDPVLRGLFSQRAAGIRQHLAADPRASARAAYYATRPDKDRHRTAADLLPLWRERAERFGHGIEGLGRLPAPNLGASDRHTFDPDRVVAALGGPRRSAPGATIAHVDLVALVAAAHPAGAPAATIEVRTSAIEREAGGDRAVAPADRGPLRAPERAGARGERIAVAAVVSALERGVGTEVGVHARTGPAGGVMVRRQDRGRSVEAPPRVAERGGWDLGR